jgi:hypothetical protein
MRELNLAFLLRSGKWVGMKVGYCGREAKGWNNSISLFCKG